jgi:regulator of protease activity HflC (stomatin/prohibitin superfamily)
MFLVVLLWHRILVTIPPGSVGVLWLRFFGGTVTDGYLGEGTKLIFPWDRVYIYDTRLQRLDLVTTTLSNDGLPVTIETVISFSAMARTAGELHAAVGPQYIRLLIDPLSDSELRVRIAADTAERLYSVAYRAIESEIAAGLQRKIAEALPWRPADRPLIRIADVSVRSIRLPESVRASIESKFAAQQAVPRTGFLLEQERIEAQRREVEAEGIRRFQQIVTPGITDSFLRWRGIEATLALSQSPNAKIVVIGNGSGGLPLILDGRGDPSVPAAGAAQPPPPPGAPVPPVRLPAVLGLPSLAPLPGTAPAAPVPSVP